MKRFLAALSAVMILLALLCAEASASIRAPGARAFYTSGSADDDEAQGLHTVIPYVPKYTGELSSQSRVILMDLETGNALIEQNGDVRAYPASTTKIMTATLLIENTADDEWDVRIPPLQEVNSKISATGTQLGLKVGDEPTRRELLYGLMLPSGCDCAYVIACLLGGSETDFVLMMNERASEIGMNNTGFENAHGVASNGHYTTAEDLSTLVRHAMQYEIFRKTVSTEYITLKIKNGSSYRTLTPRNTNYLLRHDSPYYYSYAIGVKTGTTDLADHCLTSAARKNGLELIAIVMNSDSNTERYSFSKEILEWGFRYYASEGGMYSMTVTNAFFKAAEGGCGVYEVPDSTSDKSVPVGTVSAGAGVRVGAYRYDKNGALWYMIWHDGAFKWAKNTELEFVCYINDISADIGSALSGVTLVGEDPDIDGVIASRHLVKAVTVTVYDENGQPVTGGSNYPAASCTHTLLGTTVDLDVDLSNLPAGNYTCVTHVEAVAFVPDAPDREYFTVDEKSTLIIAESAAGTDSGGKPVFDSCVYSYNANTGHGAPDGGTVQTGSAFTVTDVVPERPGCVFAGWNTESDGSGTSYSAGDSVTCDKSITLYAMWGAGSNEWKGDLDAVVSEGRIAVTGSAVNTAGITSAVLTVTDDKGAEVFTKTLPCPVNTVDGSLINDELSALELDDGKYTLELLAAVSTGSAQNVFSKQLEISSQSSYKLVLVPNGGAFSVETDDLTVVSGEKFGSLPVPVKDGYTFDGWYDNDEKLINENSVVPESSNGLIVLHANWSEGSGANGDPIHVINVKPKGLAAVPLWVWLLACLLVFAGLVTLIIVILRKPDKNSAEE